MVMAKDEKHFRSSESRLARQSLSKPFMLTAAQHSHYNVLEGENVVDSWKIHTGWYAQTDESDIR